MLMEQRGKFDGIEGEQGDVFGETRGDENRWPKEKDWLWMNYWTIYL